MGVSLSVSQVSVRHNMSNWRSWKRSIVVSTLFLIDCMFYVAAFNRDLWNKVFKSLYVEYVVELDECIGRECVDMLL